MALFRGQRAPPPPHPKADASSRRCGASCQEERAMGAATTAASTVLLLAAAAAAVTAQNATNTTLQPTTDMPPLFMDTAPKLDRAHKNKLLVEAPCKKYCSSVVWQLKEGNATTWQWADAEPHSNFPDTFYVRRLRPDTDYTLRGLLKASNGIPYFSDDIPTLQARTCPEEPPPVEGLHAHSAGPGWLEVRWTPPPKERCKSHLYYQARYAPHGHYFSAWRQYGYFRTERWVHFRPTHPCAVWPAQFCMLVADSVKAGDQHVVEVRVSRFDELTPALSESRKVVVRADTGCLVNDTCGVIGAAPAIAAPSAAAPAIDEVDLDDSDLPSTASDITTPRPLETMPPQVSGRGASESAGGDGGGGVGEGEGAAARRAAAAGDSAFGRLAPLFLALALLACAALPAAFLWGKRRGAREAVELHLVPAWRSGRAGGDGGSQPVLSEEGGEGEGDERPLTPALGAALEVDRHGRFSWAKLPHHD